MNAEGKKKAKELPSCKKNKTEKKRKEKNETDAVLLSPPHTSIKQQKSRNTIYTFLEKINFHVVIIKT